MCGPDERDVLAAKNGDVEAFERLYRGCFAATYDFAVRTVRDPHRAADVVQEAWLKAYAGISGLRNPAAFRAWVFAIVRREALATFRAERRTSPVPAGSAGVPHDLARIADVDPRGDPVVAAELEDSARLVWEAATALDPKTYTVLDLQVRQGLSTPEIAEVLGISAGHAATLVHRTKERVGAAIGTYLLIRRGARDCAELRRLVGGARVPPVDRRLHRRVDRHVRSCATCRDTRRRLVAPMEIFAALAAVGAPEGLEDRIWGRLASTPFPPPPPAPSRGRLLVVGVMLAVVFLLGVLAAVGGAGRGTPRAASPPATTSPATGSGTSSSSVATHPVNVTAPPPGGITTSTNPVTTLTPPSSATLAATTVPPSTTSPTTTITTTTTTVTTTTTLTTTTTTTLAGDVTPPTIRRAAVSPAEIWEEDLVGATCGAVARQATILADVVDDVAVDRVTASWSLAGATTITLAPSGTTSTGTFGPFPAGTVPAGTSPTVPITIRAVDTSGNTTTASTPVVVHSAASCP